MVSIGNNIDFEFKFALNHLLNSFYYVFLGLYTKIYSGINSYN